MYTLIQNPFDEYSFFVYLHEDCIFDIHKVCKDLLAEFKTNFGPGEYVTKSDMVAEIAIYH